MQDFTITINCIVDDLLQKIQPNPALDSRRKLSDVQIITTLLNIKSVYIIDSFPVPICKNIRIPRAKLLQEEVFRRYNASKREFFMALKCI